MDKYIYGTNILNYRQDTCSGIPCAGIPLPSPTQIPIRPKPTEQSIPPTISDISKRIGKWTYFWTDSGDGWVFVMQTGIAFDPSIQQLREAVWGCDSVSNCIKGTPLTQVKNYSFF